MTIPTKDQKILWSRGAGICSNCKTKLSHDSKNPSCATLIGENCHIIGENPGSARSASHMSTEDRNRYHNLILLCNACHKIVDDDETTYTIETLHKIKADHELWVEEKLLSDQKISKIYCELVEFATTKLMLNSMDTLTDNCLRCLLYKDFADGLADFIEKVFRAIFPNELPDFENFAKNLAKRAHEYLSHFHKMSRLENNWFKEDKTWKSTWHTQEIYAQYLKKSDIWQETSIRLLFNMVKALNDFCDSIRRNIKQDYFISYGKFVINDSMGVTNSLEPISYIPETYRDE